MTARLLIALIFCTIVFSSAVAQFPNTNKLNTWTTRPVSRRHATDTTYLRRVRVARHSAFDRVVFDFSGAMPNYRVEYLKSRFYENEAGTNRIKMAGRAFVQVSLSVIPTDDEQMSLRNQKNFIPKGRLQLPSVWELDDATHFEGYYDFLLGISGRKLFRVTELTNPLRLVIDFRR